MLNDNPYISDHNAVERGRQDMRAQILNHLTSEIQRILTDPEKRERLVGLQQAKKIVEAQ